MSVCEFCGDEHNGEYGSGRFCSSKCARAYSRKSQDDNDYKKKVCCIECGKEIEINKRANPNKAKCKQCKIEYQKSLIQLCKGCKTNYTKGKSGYCKKCFVKYGVLNKPKKDSSKMGGPRQGGGRAKVYKYISPIAGKMKLNKYEIEVAKKLDEMQFQWKRNVKGFSYIDLFGLERKYYPDFYIEDFNLYLEYKGWVDKKLNHKMDSAYKKHKFNFIIIYSMDKRYKNLGVNLNEFKDNPMIIQMSSNWYGTGLQN